MANRILLYGATGYSGRLIAAEVSDRIARGTHDGVEVVLGGRDQLALEELSEEHQLDHVVFALDDHPRVDAALRQFDAVLNVAGPFADTALRLAKSAIATGCHYVDINGEVDVYQALDDLGKAAANRRVAIVSGAGFTATVSDLMLDRALQLLSSEGWSGDELNVRIAVARMTDFSRGSVITMLRSVREEVMTVRRGSFVHVPVGRLERSFDFGTTLAAQAVKNAASDRAVPPRRRIASAVNVLDTVTAFHTMRRQDERSIGSIELYVDMPRPIRLGYQLGALTTVFFQMPAVQRLARFQLAQLPDGPDQSERENGRETVLVNIESRLGEPWVDWRMETPNAYDVTTRCALSIATRLATGAVVSPGWTTPSQVLPLPKAVSMLAPSRVALADNPFMQWTFHSRPVLRVTP